MCDYSRLYEQDIDGSSSGDTTTISGQPTGNMYIASKMPGYKPFAYRAAKAAKGGRKAKKQPKPILKHGDGRGPDVNEYYGPAQ